MSEKQNAPEHRLTEIRQRWSRTDIPEQLFSAHVKQDIDYLLSLLQQPTSAAFEAIADEFGYNVLSNLARVVDEIGLDELKRRLQQPTSERCDVDMTGKHQVDNPYCKACGKEFPLCVFPATEAPSVQPPAETGQPTAARTYRDRWCDHCNTNHRYFTGWTNEGSKHDQLSDLQTEQHCLPQTLSTVDTGSDAAAKAQRDSAQAGEVKESKSITPSTPTTGEREAQIEKAVRSIMDHFLTVEIDELPDSRTIRSVLQTTFPPTETPQTPTCANCGKKIHYAGGQWYHDESGLGGCGMMAVAVPVVGDAGEVERLRRDSHMNFKAAGKALTENERLRSELASARANAIRECAELARAKSEEYRATAERYAEHAKRETLPEAKVIDEDSRNQCFAKQSAMTVFAASLESLAKDGDDENQPL